jgi:hypothetical protein
MSFIGSSDPVEVAKSVMCQKHNIEAVDSVFGELFQTLTDLGLVDNTVFMVTSDNGTESGVLETPFVHGKRSVYEGGLRTPLWVRAPFASAVPRSSNALVGPEDFWPTIMDIIKGYPAGYNSDVINEGAHARSGKSFVPILKDKDASNGKLYNFSMFGSLAGTGWSPSKKRYVPPSGKYAINDGTYKYIRTFSVSTVVEELFLMTNPIDAFLELSANNLVTSAPTDPLTISNKARLSAALDVILNS